MNQAKQIKEENMNEVFSDSQERQHIIYVVPQWIEFRKRIVHAHYTIVPTISESDLLIFANRAA
jgi:hypothetical protein